MVRLANVSLELATVKEVIDFGGLLVYVFEAWPASRTLGDTHDTCMSTFLTQMMYRRETTAD
jgi:hypothetical protein